MTVRVLARIQHTPSRAQLIPPLLARLKGIPTEIITHESEPASPWAGYQQCLADPPTCTHLLIAQDDCVPADNFASAVKAIAAAHPDTPVCLFLARLPRDVSAKAEQAYKRNQRYVPLSQRSFLPIVAVLWPRHKAVEFSEWAEEHPVLPGVPSRAPRSDDAMGGRWKMVTRQHIVACVPSIVEHPDQVPSTIGRTAQWGRDKGRVAALFTEDASLFDW